MMDENYARHLELLKRIEQADADTVVLDVEDWRILAGQSASAVCRYRDGFYLMLIFENGPTEVRPAGPIHANRIADLSAQK